ncbi:hypothetical protein BC629DRAFT_1257103, partial [Irpex lacteus]
TATINSMASPPNFASKELAQILAEQGSAIRGYAIRANTELEASAEVQLLEGTAVVISLTARGYQIVGHREVHESVEDALHAVSPRYTEARHAELLSRLASLE